MNLFLGAKLHHAGVSFFCTSSINFEAIKAAF